MRIIVAEEAGFCYGVKRAINLALNSISKKKKIYTLGPLIHNPQVVEKLALKGIMEVTDIEDIDKGTIIFRSHGVSPKVYKKAKEKGLHIIDATCPNVAKVQKIANQLKKKGYPIVVIGDKDHPEVKSILEVVNNEAYSLSSIKDVDLLPKNISRLGVVAQTTQSIENFKRIINKLISMIKEIWIFNTICEATLKRQKSSLELAKKADLMIVIGGYNSANTKRLLEICKKVNKNSYHIEEAKEIEPLWIKGKDKVGITAGASTPSWIIKEVVEKITKEIE